MWTVDRFTGNTVQWTDGSRFVRWPCWSPDGRFIVYTRSRTGQEPDTLGGLRLLDTVTHDDRAFLHDGLLSTYVGGPARYSPDGQQLVFSVPLGEQVGGTERSILEIFLMGADGMGYRRLTHLRGRAENPQWCVQDNTIIFDFTSCLDAAWPERSTWTIRPDGSGLRQWPVNLGDPRVQFGFPFALSPDGARVAFIGRDPAGTTGVLWTMKLDGRNRKQLTSF